MSDKPPLKELAPLDMWDSDLWPLWPIFIPLWVVAALIRLPWCIWKAYRTRPTRKPATPNIKAHMPLSEGMWKRLRTTAQRL